MEIPGKTSLAAIAILVFSSGSGTALAQQIAPAEQPSAAAIQNACRTDYGSFCTGDDPAIGLMQACLRQYFLSLSAACQKALSAASSTDSSGDAAQTGQSAE